MKPSCQLNQRQMTGKLGLPQCRWEASCCSKLSWEVHRTERQWYQCSWKEGLGHRCYSGPELNRTTRETRWRSHWEHHQRRATRRWHLEHQWAGRWQRQ